MEATVVIVTKDRREQLRTAVTSALAQEGDIEVLVVDDGSSDGTAAMLSEQFPAVRVQRFDDSAGLVVRRNEGARLARGGILFSLDDDALFTTPRVVRQTLADFDHPRIGAVAIPHVDVKYSPQERDRAPDDREPWVTSTYRGTAHAVRRDVFLSLGGYRADIVHQGEEPDFTLRMLAAGRVVRLGRSDAIHHLESPNRSLARMTVYGRRNEMVMAFRYFRPPWNLFHAALWAGRGFRAAARHGVWPETFRGLRDGASLSWRGRHERELLPRPVLALHRDIRRRGPLRLRSIESRLPPAC